MRHPLRFLLALAILLVSTSRSIAAEHKPYMVCLLPSYESIIGVLNFFAKATDDPAIREAISSEPLAKLAALKGLDKKKPAGILAFRENENQKYILFCGITDLKSLLNSLPLATPPKRRGDVWEIQFGEGPICPVVEKGGWAFFCDPDLIQLIPANPLPLFDGLDKDYMAAFRVNFRNLTAAFRKNYNQNLDLFSWGAVYPKVDGDGVAGIIGNEMLGGSFDSILVATDDTVGLTCGAIVDQQSGTSTLDFSKTFQSGSAPTKRLSELPLGKSDFAGFLLPEAAIGFNVAIKIGPDGIASLVAKVQQYRANSLTDIDKDPTITDPAEKKRTKEAVDDLFSALADTIKSGRLDGGIALTFRNGSLAAACGASVRDPDRIERAVKQWLLASKNDPALLAVKFDVETHENVRFDRLTLAQSDPQVKPLLGDKLELYLGIGKDRVYVSFGNGSLELLKSIIDRSTAEAGRVAPPMRLCLNCTSLARVAIAAAPSDPSAVALSHGMGANARDGHLCITLSTIENGVKCRIEVEKETMRLFAALLRVIPQYD